MTRVAEAARAVVEYPAEGETVRSPEYTFRIKAEGAHQVELSINGSLWEPCRESVGYWWYDWSGFRPGRHQVVARVHEDAGPARVSRPRKFRVEL